MQAASDTMLGWIHVTGLDGLPRDFYLRQLWDAKGSAQIELMEPKTMEVYARLCGQTLARAHARSGDAVAISSYLGTSDAFDRSLAAFAERYADQNERDYAALKEAADSSRVQVEYGL
jgi:predicted alpha/beta hydrolase